MVNSRNVGMPELSMHDLLTSMLHIICVDRKLANIAAQKLSVQTGYDVEYIKFLFELYCEEHGPEGKKPRKMTKRQRDEQSDTWVKQQPRWIYRR